MLPRICLIDSYSWSSIHCRTSATIVERWPIPSWSREEVVIATLAPAIKSGKRVIAAHYPDKDLAVTVIGQAAKIRKAVAKYGTLTEKSITEPGY